MNLITGSSRAPSQRHVRISFAMDNPKTPSKIIPFFEGQTFFLTGTTGFFRSKLTSTHSLGFLGKVLLYKLLKECPGIQEIYCLVRGKKELSAPARFQKEVLETSILFSGKIGKLAKQKVKVVDGDIAKSKLGMPFL